MSKDSSSDQYTEAETTARAEAALKRMLATPPKPHKEMKIGKRKAKARPASKGSFHKGITRG
jgi:hypothetical protein